MHTPTAYLFFGRSGSGKGTQSELLRDYLTKHRDAEPLYLSIGRHLREFIAEDKTFTRERAGAVIDGGGLLPAFIPIHTWGMYFDKHFDGKRDVICEGVARNHLEAQVVAEAIEFYELVPAHIIYLDVEPEQAKEWLLARARTDDTPEAIEKRFSWFDSQVRTSLDYFKDDERFRFHTIAGGRSIEDVHRDIVKQIEA